MHYRSVDGIILADSMYAAYVDSSAPAALGIARAVVPEDVGVFVRFARDAVSGNKQMLVIHSEVYPGTYASTTETADHLLDPLALARTPVLASGPVGMQQLSRVRDGEFELFGFAGNSAPDHLDHLYGLGRWIRVLLKSGM